MENNMIAVVNPITRVATILHKVGEVLHNVELSYKELDEWGGFETDIAYAVHFDYDEMFRICIYEDETDEEYHGLQNVDFLVNIEYNDEDYNSEVSFSTLKLQGNEQAQVKSK